MRLLPPAAIVSLLLVTACAPQISLDRTQGVPHTLVNITGTRLDDSTIIWDADTPNETVIPGGFGGAYLFSVPPSATATTPTSHNVRVKHGWRTSNVVAFTVTPTSNDTPVPFTNPRIDSITMSGTHFEGTQVSVSLYVQGANIDVGAVVKVKPMLSSDVQNTANVDGEGYELLATATHQGLRHNWFGVSQTEMDYPISHFVSLIAILGAREAGSQWSVEVENLDGKKSPISIFKVPTEEASLDSDGDGLLDTWETNGYSAPDGSVVDLVALGAKPYRRDIFVELDAMPAMAAGAAATAKTGLTNPVDRATFDVARAMFNAAPFLNPNDPPGINLYLDTSGAVPYTPEVCFDLGTASGCTDDPANGRRKFSTLKATYFDNTHRDRIFHYAIWGDTQTYGPKGQSDFGDDFLITLDSVANFTHSIRSHGEALAHELGHDLGLHHGGGDDEDFPYRPNHWSVMTLTWGLRTGFGNQFRVDHATCPPFYYSKSGASEPGGAIATNGGTAVDYSSGMAKKLVPPSAASVNTNVCGTQVNWEADGNFNTLTDIADWPHLVYDGPATNGFLTP